MKRIASVALALVLSVFAVTPAFAGEKGAGKAQFPMKAEVFQQRVDAHLTKAKARMEKRITDKKLDAEKAKTVRAKFEERANKVRTAAKEAEKDGTVTAEEAKTVHNAGGGGKHHRGRAAKK